MITLPLLSYEVERGEGNQVIGQSERKEKIEWGGNFRLNYLVIIEANIVYFGRRQEHDSG